MEKSAVRFERGGHLEIAASIFIPALPDQTEPAAQPCIAQRAVDCHRVLERAFGLVDFVFRAEQESEEGVCGWVARRKLHTFFECRFRLWDPPKAEMQFRHARPGKAKFRIDLGGVLCCLQRARKISLRLQIIRFRDPIARGPRGVGIGPRFESDCCDQRKQSLSSRGSAAGSVEQSLRLLYLTDGQQ